MLSNTEFYVLAKYTAMHYEQTNLTVETDHTNQENQ